MGQGGEIVKKRLVVYLLLPFLLLSLASCTSTQNTKSETAQADGYGGLVEVTVTVEDKEITKVEAVGESETDGIGTIALERLPQQIVEHQSINLDTISNATKTSQAVLLAAKEALLKLGFTESEISKEVVKDVGEKIVKEADVVIIGGGGAGMSAAVEALKAGASVIVIEKTSSPGGNTKAAGSAMNAADPAMQKDLTMTPQEMERIKEILELEPKGDLMAQWQATLSEEIEEYEANNETYLFDSPSLHKLQTYIDGDYVANPVLLDVYGDNALDSVEFLRELGTTFRDQISAAVGATWKRSHTPTYTYGGAGSDFVMPQVEYATENGADIMTDAKADTILMDQNGRAVGVSGLTTDNQEFEITANKGVIIATGGFGANVEMRMDYNKHWANLDETIQTTNLPSATGDGIAMGQEIGVNLVGMEWIQLIPTYFGGVVTPYIDSQIYINQEGERYVNEDNRRDVLSAKTLEQTGSYLYIINDRDVIDENNTVAVLGSDITSKVESGDMIKADTIEELAAAIDVPYETLQKTIDDFNKAVDAGQDDLGRTLFDQKIDQAPFWAGKTSPVVHHTMGGLEINEHTQVLDTQGNVIPGLYAAGEVTGGIHGSNRLGGNAITDVITFGRIAGQNAAAGK